MMRITRSFLVLVEMAVFAAGAFTIGFVIFPMLSLFFKGEKKRACFSEIVRRAWKFFIFIMEKSRVIKINVKGNLQQVKGKIVVSSHPSYIDIILLIGSMPKSLCLAKKELLNNLLLKNIVKSLYIINDLEPKAFRSSALEALNKGYDLIIFPVGTRHRPGEDIKIHKGAAQIALASGVNIVPIRIETDYPFMCKNHSPFDAGEKVVNYYITVLPEIKISDFDIEALGEIKSRNRICEKIKKCIN